MTDTREKLEADIRKLYTHSISTLMYPPSANKTTDYIKSVSVDTVLGWLDRQAAITRAECEEICDTCEWPSLAAQPDQEAYDRTDELQARLEKSHRDWLVDVGEYEQIADGMKKQIAELERENADLMRDLKEHKDYLDGWDMASAKWVLEKYHNGELHRDCDVETICLLEKEELQAKVDELQAQLDRSMPLPLDADGVPIRVGDTVEYSDGYEMWTMRVGMIGRECVEECESGVVAKICRHVKRDDPLVELAIDLISDGFLADVPRSEWDVRATEVARLIRETLKEVRE